jgi:isoleucyl-tRNA synthetase
LAEFPGTAELAALRDEPLEQRWEILLEARSAVNAKLEELREKKAIGSSLQASVTIDVDEPAAAALLKQSSASLPMLFIVSNVELGPMARAANVDDRLSEGKAGAPRRWLVDARAADGEKCARCWRIVPSVSSAPDSQGLCDRCVDALTAGGVVG